MGGELPVDLIMKLRQYGSVSTFVETGTYHGRTAFWAANVFEKIITIELSERLHQLVVAEATANMLPKGRQVTTFLQGDSKKCLKDIVGKLNAPAIFWLDAHYSGADTAGTDCECPLLQELAAILDSDIDHYILIDDVRMFSEPVPEPHDPDQWPTMSEIVSMLSKYRYSRWIVGDILVASRDALLGMHIL